MTTPDERVQLAHGDAWQAEGRLRVRFGGGAVELAGARLSSSGLPHAQWNNGDLVELASFDLEAVRAWYAMRAHGAGVPWGMRVPSGVPFQNGRFLFAKRCMALAPTQFVPASLPSKLVVDVATTHDIDEVAQINAAAFNEPLVENLAWIAPHLGASGFTVAIARLNSEPVGTATAVLTDDRAGRCVGIFGVAVLADARRRGIGAALTSWLVRLAFDAGATLGHLSPNDESAARLYARLGFVETAGFDVYVNL